MKSKGGFTLVELMVALVVASIATVGIFRAYLAITSGFDKQEQIIELQQNLRLGLEMMSSEIRMAGYDPSRTAGAGFTTADSNTIRFTKDLNGNGTTTDSGEDITFALSTTDLTKSGDPVVSNVDALNLVYLDEDGDVLSSPGSTDIRAVEVTLVVRTSAEDYGYTNTASYENYQGTVIYTASGDNFHRRVLTAMVRCQNMGL